MELRPPTDVFERNGWRFTIVDAPDILAAAVDGPVEMLPAPAFPPPIRSVRMSVAIQGGQVLLGAQVQGGSGRRTGLTALGRDPIGALLARRLDAGDPVANRIVDGLETAVGEVSRRLGRPRTVAAPPEPGLAQRTTTVVDVDTGLRTTVTHHAGPIVVLQASVAADDMTPAHLAAFADALVRSARPGGSGELTMRRSRLAERVTLDQVGGLDEVVAQFRDIATSFRHPQAMARWGARRPQGVLLYGPAGTGKTMLARALANEIGGTLREIRTTEILDKWLGASERNMKRIFREARRYTTPTVLLFDEFDSIISYAGAGEDSGSQAVNAVAGIFKQEMNDLIEDNPNVIVMATTNFPDRIDASLIRSGRFDVKLEIPMPDPYGRAQILTRMMRDLIAQHEAAGFRMFAEDVDVRALAALTEGRSGADLKEMLRRAQLAKAMAEARTGAAATPISQADLIEVVAL